MRIAIVNLTGGGLSGGYRKYLQHLLPEMAADPRVSDLMVCLPPQAEFEHDMVSHTRTWPANDPMRGYSWLKAQVDAFAADVVFVPTARWLDFGGRPTAVLVHNMEPLVVPVRGNSLAEGARNLVRARMSKLACQRADRVLVPSRYVRDYVVGRWGIAPTKVGVVYNGIEGPPTIGESQEPEAVMGRTLGPFLFTAGSIRPARGLEDLIEALAILLQDGKARDLLVAGSPDAATRAYRNRLSQKARKLGLGSHVIWAGQLESREMSWCYYHCGAFVMTSRVEAGPNIVLEALSHGALCISTDNPPMPEFFRDAALYYKSRSADSLAGILLESHGLDKAKRQALRQCARQRAAEFSWRDTARRTIQEFCTTRSQAVKR